MFCCIETKKKEKLFFFVGQINEGCQFGTPKPKKNYTLVKGGSIGEDVKVLGKPIIIIIRFIITHFSEMMFFFP